MLGPILRESRQAIDCFQRGLALSTRGSTEMLEAYYGNARRLRQAAGRPRRSAQDVPRSARDLSLRRPIALRDGQLHAQSRADRSGQPGLSIGGDSRADQSRDLASFVAPRGGGHVPEPVARIARTKTTKPAECWTRRSPPAAIRRGCGGGSSICTSSTIAAARRLSKSPSCRPTNCPPLSSTRSARPSAGLVWRPKRNGTQARTFLQTAYDAGCRDVICLRWLAVTLISCDQFRGRADPAPMAGRRAGECRSAEISRYDLGSAFRIGRSRTPEMQRPACQPTAHDAASMPPQCRPSLSSRREPTASRPRCPTPRPELEAKSHYEFLPASLLCGFLASFLGFLFFLSFF